MACIAITKRIDAPPETVFEVTTDLQRAAEQVRGIKKIELLTTLPVCVGTRWRETRKMMGHERVEVLEVTAFDPPHSYTVGCVSCGAYLETTFRFAAAGDQATELTLNARMEARTLMATLMSPIGSLMFGATMRRCLADDLEDVKRVAESRAAALSGHRSGAAE